MISVIIPTLNAERTLAHTLSALVPAVVEGIVQEAILVDGGSTDETCAIAEAAGTHLIEAPRGRGSQLEAGAHHAKGDWLLFLHADTVLEPGWAEEAQSFIERVESGRRPQAAASFRFALDDDGLMPRVVEGLVGLRCSVLALPYGDQGLLISRNLYNRLGGFRPLAADGGRRSGAPAQAARAGDAEIARGDERRALPARGLSRTHLPQSRLHAALLSSRAAAGARATLWLGRARGARAGQDTPSISSSWPRVRRRPRQAAARARDRRYPSDPLLSPLSVAHRSAARARQTLAHAARHRSRPRCRSWLRAFAPKAGAREARQGRPRSAHATPVRVAAAGPSDHRRQRHPGDRAPSTSRKPSACSAETMPCSGQRLTAAIGWSD